MIIRIIFGIVFFTVALAASLLLLGVLSVKRALPQYEGEVKVPGLKQQVEIYRDSFAIAHIYGASEIDCYYGLGYAQAQERLFQMDFTRRIGRGRLSEVLGPDALMIDKWARTIGFAHIADNMVRRMSPSTKAILTAYTAGVNACIHERNGKYGMEFDALSYSPDPWKIEDCLVIARLMSWEMNFSFWTDAAFSDIALKVDSAHLAALYPTYPAFAPTSLEGPLPRTAIRPLTPRPVVDTIKADTSRVPRDTAHGVAVLSNYREQLAEVFTRYNIGFAGGGSNAFAISPKRSKTGGAILENDLHLAIRTPARFYLAHLESRDGLSCAGFTIPGLPIFTSGRNKYVSWGVTNGMIDECDYVILATEKNSAGYQTPSGTAYFKTTVENIPIRAKTGEDVTSFPLAIRTSEFGPIISDLYTFDLAKKFTNDSLQEVGKGLQTQIGRTPNIALHWNGSYTLGDEVGSFLQLPKAKKAGADMMTNFATPCLNLITADAHGNITYNLIGRVPRRSGSEEQLLLPRHSDDSGEMWKGFVTSGDLPHTANPAQGFVLSANNPSTRTRSIPHSMNWEPPARSERLYQLLISQTKSGVKEINTTATDYLSLFDRDVLLPPLMRVMRGNSLDTSHYGRLAEEALDYLENWGGVQQSEDVATTILQVYMLRLFVHAFHDDLGPELFSEFTYINNVPVRTLAALLDDEWNIVWDDIRSPQRESRDTIIRHAFFDAVRQCQSLLGNDLRRWNWGRLHPLVYRHPFATKSPEVAQIGNIDQGYASGSLTTVVQSSYTFWDPFRMIVGPSMRFIADMSTSEVHVVQPTGNSGDLFSPHYRDMARMFRDGGSVAFSLGAPSHAWKKLVLTPSK